MRSWCPCLDFVRPWAHYVIKRSFDRGHSPNAARKRAVLRWRKAFRFVQLTLRTGAKVDAENKVGAPLKGWYEKVALALQAGIAREFNNTTNGGAPSMGAPYAGHSMHYFDAPEPRLFERVRAACDISQARYAATLGLQRHQQKPSLRMEPNSAGRSGACFFHTPDQQLIAKSCKPEDYRTLLRVLPQYVEHLEAAREENSFQRVPSSILGSPSHRARQAGHIFGLTGSLLPRYLGLYKFQVESDETDKVETVRIVVMINVFGGARQIHRRYDLKGSTSGRSASAKERKKPKPVFLDLDWLQTERKLGIGESARSRLMKTLSGDVRFLRKLGLIDYSLLVGIHERRDNDEDRREVNNVVYVEDFHGRLCYLGIVDVLTPYGWRKWAETFMKDTLMGGIDISCQPPQRYGDRFLAFLGDRVFGEAE